MEAALYDAGLDVIDTSGEYPAYLMTADRFRDFWQNVQSGKTAEQEAITVRSGVGCAAGILNGILRGTEPTCDCSKDSGSCC